MNTYAIWCDLIDSSRDVEFAQNIAAFLGWFQARGDVDSWTLERRKFGFGPDALGEFHVRIQCTNLDQLDRAFSQAATRAEPIESLHAAVFRNVKNFRSALYRSFPDPERTPPD